MDYLILWVSQNFIEVIAASLGIVGIFFQIKQHHLYWLTSIIMVLLYIYVFYKAKFYADMSFQFYYLAVSLYGWYYWLTGKSKKSNALNFKRFLNIKQLSISLFASVLIWIVIYLILRNFTDSDLPLGDSFTTALSFSATWLLARKYIENWLFWIVVNIVSTVLYVYKGLYPTAILFVILTILAVVGYFKWRKFELSE